MGLTGLRLVHSRRPLHGHRLIEGGQPRAEGPTTLVRHPRQVRSVLGVAPAHLLIPGMLAGPAPAPAIPHDRGHQTVLPTSLSTCVPGGHVRSSPWLLAHASTCHARTEDSSGDDREVGAPAHKRDHSRRCLAATGHHPRRADLMPEPLAPIELVAVVETDSPVPRMGIRSCIC